MNNFFYDESDYSLFMKALKTTEHEPVVINILSTDSSLQTKKETTVESASARKNMSKKYEPSPFGKFFGPRRQQPTSVDMKDFSSWKNKNYRKAEASIDDRFSNEVKFSMSDFMSDKSKSKFNELDQTKSDLQKPITQLSSSDPLYKRFSLDSYMHKLEEQTKVKDSFEQNDDILEPLGDDTQQVVPDSSQDENFGFGSNVNIEKVAFDENISGDQFKFEQEELDKFRAWLDKIEREAANIKEKQTEKVIDTNPLSEMTASFDIDKLTDDEPENPLSDDIEKINSTLGDSAIISTESNEVNENNQKPQVKHKTFFEINKTGSSKKQEETGSLMAAFEEIEESDQQTADSIEADSNDDVLVGGSTEESVNTLQDMTDEQNNVDVPDFDMTGDVVSGEELVETPLDSNVSTKTTIGRDDIVTKDDLKSMTDELVAKFTQIQGKDVGDLDAIVDPAALPTDGAPIVGGYGSAPDMFVYPDANFVSQGTSYPQDENERLKAQLQELIDSNKRMDLESEQRLREVQLEKERVAAEYESRIKEMEQSFKQSYEDFKKQAYLDKLDRDIKLKEAESKFKKKTAKIKEEEKETYAKERTGAMLRKELRSNLNISNLEMDKKLLEVASHLNRAENAKLAAEKSEMERRLEEEELRSRIEEESSDVEEVEEIEEVEEVEEEVEKPKTTTRKPAARKRKSSTTRRAPARKGSRRRIDSDIIGGIDFE